MKEEKKTNFIVSFLIDTAVWVVIFFVLCNYIIMPARVNGRSMYPTLTDGAYGFSTRIGVAMNGVERFDIVAIYKPEQKKHIIKRVIGLPGDTVSCVDGDLYINGEIVEEPYLDTEYAKNNTQPFTKDFGPVTLGEDEYFCMGDNRVDSHDSRNDGPYKFEQIKSKHYFIVFPFNQCGLRG